MIHAAVTIFNCTDNNSCSNFNFFVYQTLSSPYLIYAQVQCLAPQKGQQIWTTLTDDEDALLLYLCTYYSLWITD